MNVAVVLAAGRGHRYGGKMPKQFQLLEQKPLILHALLAFEKAQRIDLIVPVIRQEDRSLFLQLLKKEPIRKIKTIIDGDATREGSVKKALVYLKDILKDDDLVLIHDAARPLLQDRIITAHLDALATNDVTATVLSVQDSMIMVREKEKSIERYLPRERLFRLQTPQGFHFGLLLKAHKAHIDLPPVGDDVELTLSLTKKIALIEGSPFLIKVTTPADLQALTSMLDAARIKTKP